MISLLRGNRKKPFIGGHRGAKKIAPDNTWDGFEAGLKSGADLIECDVQILSNNQLVMFHGFSFDTENGSTAWIWDLSPSDAKLILKEKFILLEDVLDWARNRIWLALDLKLGFNFDLPIADAAVKAISRTNTADNVFFISWTHETLHQIKTMNPNLAIAPLFFSRVSNPIEYARTINADALFIRRPQLDLSLIEQAHANNIAVSPIDVFRHDCENYHDLADMGIDVMIVDDPKFAVECFDKNEQTTDEFRCQPQMGN